MVETPTGQALAGIRFFGGNYQRPFVQLVAWQGPTDPSPLVATLFEQWQEFSPEAVQVLLPVEQAPTHAELDLAIYSGTCAEIAQSGPINPDLELETVLDPEAALELVERVYVAAFEARPELDGAITPLSAEGLDLCMKEGSADWLLLNDKRIGLLTTAPDSIDWFQGSVVYERAVLPAHWGQGHATHALRRWAKQRSAKTPDAPLIGTILAANHASRRGAERCGRRMDAAYYFLSEVETSLGSEGRTGARDTE